MLCHWLALYSRKNLHTLSNQILASYYIKLPSIEEFKLR